MILLSNWRTLPYQPVARISLSIIEVNSSSFDENSSDFKLISIEKDFVKKKTWNFFFQDNLFSLTVVGGTEPEILSSQN